MKKKQQFLAAMLKTIQIGQVEIRSTLDSSMRSSLRKLLESHLTEYDSMETEAYTIASQRGWELPKLDPGKRFLTDRLVRLRLNGNRTDSTIADILIQRHTKGMIQGLKILHQFEGQDQQLQILSQKLLDSETDHIRQMKLFL